MSRYKGPEQYRPVSAWGYVGYTLLYAIPVIGLIFLIVFAISGGNVNRRNYARSYFCFLVLFLIVLLALAAFAFFHLDAIKEFTDAVFTWLEEELKLVPVR